MRDGFGRVIDYLRVSLTERCSFHCCYCRNDEDMPDEEEAAVLSFEELERICAAAVRVGITKFKITGGEPLLRRNAAVFVNRLKHMPGVKQVTLTTNGFSLVPVLPLLADAGIDGINISLDSLDRRQFQRICRADGLMQVLSAIKLSLHLGIRTKINAVLLSQTQDQILPLAKLAQKMPVDVRFIEVMPVGQRPVQQKGIAAETALQLLRYEWPDLVRTAEKRGNGPAVYYCSAHMTGCIGFIAANTHKFCRTCNRMRLTSTGVLKPCLCYSEGVDVRQLLCGNPDVLEQAFVQAAAIKPAGHCFDRKSYITEHKSMNQIGG